MPQSEVPRSRQGKHHEVVFDILEDLANLEPGNALKIPLSELAESKENTRSALNREARKRGLEVQTASDEDNLYVWQTPEI